MRRLSLLLACAVFVSSCADAPTRTLLSDNTVRASFDIADGARGGGTGFYWLPPMVLVPPTGTGTFDNTMLDALEVELCELTAGSCASNGLRRSFTRVTGNTFDRIRLFSDRQYQVMYASAADNLDPAKHYRATVRAFGVALGFVDVDVVSSLSELQAVDRTRFAALYRGQSLPISFRVDDVFPAACSASFIDALAAQVFGTGPASESFRSSIRRLAYRNRFGTASETEAALQALADELSARTSAAANDPALRALIEQLRAALYCVVGRPVPPTITIAPATLVAGVSHACGLTTDRAAYCWGNVGPALGNNSVNGSRVPVPVSGGLRFETLSAGALHTCGLTSAGSAYCWGTNSLGQLGDGTNNLRSTPVPVSGGLTFVTIAAGHLHSCGVTPAGAAYCWGSNREGRLGDGTSTNRSLPVAVVGGHVFKSIAVSRSNVLGEGHSCGVTTAGDVYCWGNNTNFQLGTGTNTSSPVPLKVSSPLTFTSVVAGTLHTCALASTAKVYCWGLGPSFAPIAGSALPVEAGGGRSFAAIAAGVYHTCGLTPAGAAYCFGVNSRGALGDGTSRADGAIGNAPVAVSGGHIFAALAAGGEFTCGLTNAGVALCWGANGGSELGDGSDGRRYKPEPVLGGLVFSSLAVGGEHNCGVTANSSAYCWGDNQSSRLGEGTTLRRHAPWPVSGAVSFASVSTSPYPISEAQHAHSCGLTTGGSLYCWGSNATQQLGIAGATRSVPTSIPGVPAFAALALGGGHSCALTTVGLTYCWGANSFGQLGRGAGPSALPGTISGGLQFTSLAAGTDHTCALTATGAAYCWGRNNRGQLGDGTSGTNRLEPVAVSGGLSFVTLAAGFEHTCGVAVGGAAYCWGYGNFGQLGNGNSGPTHASLTPVSVGGGHSFASLTAGYFHTCGLRSDGSALCWGLNQDGQLGDGTRDSRSTPVQVQGGLQFAELGAGQAHTCGLAAAGAAYCWGWTEKGRLGDEYIRQVAGGLVFRRP